MRRGYYVVAGHWWNSLWWKLRGVTAVKDYRSLCSRCHRTGQAHWSLFGCWRFKR